MAGTDENPIIYPPLEMPANVDRKKITIWSLGLALDGDIYRPNGLTEHDRVPGIVLSHGIGGDKLTCERYAAKFAASGMIAVTFSQASWGASQGRITFVDDPPGLVEGGVLEAKVRMARELLDPLEWVDCFRAAVDYLDGEPNVDPARIGAWGTSFGGGTALYATAVDKRIKALVVQVAALFNPPEPMIKIGRERAKQIARGDIDPIPQGTDILPNLRGTPHFARMAQYNVGDQVEHISVPTLILDAANEEMFDISQSGGAAHENLKAREVDTYYEVLSDIDHYGIYFAGYERGSQLALNWFIKHLTNS